jgi:hypothetical protein
LLTLFEPKQFFACEASQGLAHSGLERKLLARGTS